MKKTIIAIFISITALCHGQFSENFDKLSESNLPNGWIISKGENEAGNDFDNWKILNQQSIPSLVSNCIFTRYENSGKINEDWLVTPIIDLSKYKNSYLKFNQFHSFNGNNTTFQIRISNNSQTDKNSFKILESYDESTFSTSFSLKKIDLTKFDGESIYVAFVKIQDDGDEWYIDDIAVEGVLCNNYDYEILPIYPNPTSGILHINQKKEIKHLTIIETSGVVQIKTQNKNLIDITNLKPGIYIINMIFDDDTEVNQKVIKY